MPTLTTTRGKRNDRAISPLVGFPALNTPLGTSLDQDQIVWLTDFVNDEWTKYHDALSPWRSKMEKYERRSENDFSDRSADNELRNEETPDNIFFRNNNTLGLSNGFADFAFAQARDDLLGQFPWFQARPEGGDDEQLAADVSKHANWKIKNTNLTDVLTDALFQAVNLGTSFPKITWRRDIESYEKVATIAVGQDGKPISTSNGDFVYADDELTDTPEGTVPSKDPATVLPPNLTWEEMAIPDELVVFDNLDAALVDFHDIAFDPVAPSLDLDHTPVFHRRSIGLLDARYEFELSEAQYQAALSVINNGTAKTGQDTARTHRGEAEPSATNYDADEETNPRITMVEGYLRCDPFGNGKPIRIYVVFCPELYLIFKLDYLANVTPSAMLPVIPVRCYRIPGRVAGVGYLERYDETNDFVDSEFNAIIYHDRMASSPPGGYHEDAVEEDLDDENITLSPNKLWKLAPDRSIEDFIQFARIPDVSNRAESLMNIGMQVSQLRTGITSAAQGELKGIPQASTATGVKQVVSRGATLLKWPIDSMKGDLTKVVSYAVYLLYANQNAAETFAWGEGKDLELIEIEPGDVRGMQMNVSFVMSQTQNMEKLETVNTAINLLIQYIQIPEQEKGAARPLFVKAIHALGFNDADEMIREPVTSAEGLAQMLPENLQQPFMQWLASAQAEAVPPEGQAMPPQPMQPQPQGA